MAVVSFAEAAQRLYGGGDFFAPRQESGRTPITDWTRLFPAERGIEQQDGSPREPGPLLTRRL